MEVVDRRMKRTYKRFGDMVPGDTFLDDDDDLCLKIDAEGEHNAVCVAVAVLLSFDDEAEFEIVNAKCVIE